MHNPFMFVEGGKNKQLQQQNGRKEDDDMHQPFMFVEEKKNNNKKKIPRQKNKSKN